MINSHLPQKSITLNVPQMIFATSKKKETYLELGRGTGKSTIIGWRMKDIVNFMPRSKTGIVGESYQQILTRTLPSTIEGLELLGIKKDLHYFVGRKPPKEWKFAEAYQPPLNYDNYIPFYNGAGFQLISLDNPNSGRGLNLDAVIGDEAVLFDVDKLGYNVLASNRGNIHKFKHTWLHHSLLFASSTPLTLRGRWFLNQEEKAKLSPEDILYLRASSLYNAHNLGKEFFKQNKRLLTDLQYNAEILCIRPGKVAAGFYPSFDEILHTINASNDDYLFGLEFDINRLREVDCRMDADLIRSMPIDLACDYGAKINTLVCGQPDYARNRFNVLNALFVKTPLTIMDLAKEFCKYYGSHAKKEVNYYYDHTAMYRDAVRTTTFADEFTKVLEANGWTVNRIYCGQAPRHDTKYIFFDIVFKEESIQTPVIRINKFHCKNLITSIQQAGTVEGRNGIEKDKRPERHQNAVDEETTHFSDAFDTLIFFKYKDGLAQPGFFV